VIDNCDKSDCPLKSNPLTAGDVVFQCAHCLLLIDHPCGSDIDSFDLFRMSRSFDVDANRLKKDFKALQRTLHPDKFARVEEAQKELAEEWSARVNDAYAKLLKPLDRALYMLEVDTYAQLMAI
jgi:hypothetical protein